MNGALVDFLLSHYDERVFLFFVFIFVSFLNLLLQFLLGRALVFMRALISHAFMHTTPPPSSPMLWLQ